MKKIMYALVALALSFNASSQNLVDKQTVKIIVPSAAGGGLDTVARTIGKSLSEIMKVPVIVENKPGANGIIAAKSVLVEPSDGKTILFYTPHGYTINNILAETPQQVFQWDKDLSPVSMMYWSPFMILINSKQNVKTLAELKEKFKDKEVTFGSTGVGTPPHIYAELIFEKVGIKYIHVPYKSLPQITNDVLGGTLDLVASSSLITHVRAGNLTPLILVSDKPNPEFPNLQRLNGTFAEFSDLKFVASFLVNKDTDPTIREKLRKDIELATRNTMEELRQRNVIDASESIVLDEKKMKQIEKNWVTATEKIKNKR